MTQIKRYPFCWIYEYDFGYSTIPVYAFSNIHNFFSKNRSISFRKYSQIKLFTSCPLATIANFNSHKGFLLKGTALGNTFLLKGTVLGNTFLLSVVVQGEDIKLKSFAGNGLAFNFRG